MTLDNANPPAYTTKPRPPTDTPVTWSFAESKRAVNPFASWYPLPVIVGFCNNAPVAELRRLFGLGQYPAQKLWGATYLEAMGHEVRYIEPRGWQARGLHTISERLRWRFGDVAIERVALKQLQECDIVFAGCESILGGLAALRSAGMLATPLACVFHNPPLRLMSVRGYDLAFALTDEAHRALLRAGRMMEAMNAMMALRRRRTAIAPMANRTDASTT